MKQRSCKYCAKEIKGKWRRVFCSSKCSRKFHIENDHKLYGKNHPPIRISEKNKEQLQKIIDDKGFRGMDKALIYLLEINKKRILKEE